MTEDTNKQIVELARSFQKRHELGYSYRWTEEDLGRQINNLMYEEEDMINKEKKRQELINVLKTDFYDMSVEELADKILKGL